MMCPHTSFYIPLFHTDTSQSTESVDESSPPLNSISTVITAVTSGVAVILLLAAICFCVIMLRKRTLKKESKSLQHRSATVSKQEEQGPQYEEIALQVHTMRKFKCRTTMSITL